MSRDPPGGRARRSRSPECLLVIRDSLRREAALEERLDLVVTHHHYAHLRSALSRLITWRWVGVRVLGPSRGPRIVADAITSCDHRPVSKGVVGSAGLGRVLHA